MRMPMPLEIVGLGKPQVCFVWDDDDEDVWSARDLRIRCTCALCQSEMTGEPILDPATVPEDLTVTHMELVGNYGLAIHFSDGHTTGIYRLTMLHDERRAAR
jgi:ATP-binding protein involved in chromosome partitioning